MAVTIKLDWFDGGGGTYTEEGGAVVGYAHTALIEGLSGATQNGNVGEAIAALNTAGITYWSATAVSTNLRLASRSLKPIKGGAFKTSMACDLEYKDALSLVPPVGQWIGQVNSTVNQIQTAKDYFGNTIFVEHTYPVNDLNHPGEYIQQGGEVTQYRPQIEITFKGSVQIAKPSIFVQTYIGRMNSTTWGGLQAGQWLCTSIVPTLVNLATSPATYLVEATFQADFEGWGQPCVFTDPSTGKVPYGLIYGIGIKNVRTQPTANFNILIPT